jgi:hypothetical protein
MSLWRVFQNQPSMFITPAIPFVTLEYLGKEDWRFGGGTPPVGTYIGDGELGIATGGANGADCRNYFFFHMHYEGPPISYPFSNDVGMDFEHRSGALATTNSDGTPQGDFNFSILSGMAAAGLQPHTRFDHTMYELWDGSAPGKTFHNLERNDVPMSTPQYFTISMDRWFIVMVRYSICTAECNFKLYSVYYERNWPTPPNRVTLLTMPL